VAHVFRLSPRSRLAHVFRLRVAHVFRLSPRSRSAHVFRLRVAHVFRLSPRSRSAGPRVPSAHVGRAPSLRALERRARLSDRRERRRVESLFGRGEELVLLEADVVA